MWHLKIDLGEMKGASHGNVRRRAFQAGRTARAKALRQEWTCKSGISRGQGGWSLGMEGERVVGEVRLGEKQARIGHDEELDLLAGSPRRVSI